jgi:hypothetical protein
MSYLEAVATVVFLAVTAVFLYTLSSQFLFNRF